MANDLMVMDAVGQRDKKEGRIGFFWRSNFIKTDLVPYDPGKLPVVRINRGDRGRRSIYRCSCGFMFVVEEGELTEDAFPATTNRDTTVEQVSCPACKNTRFEFIETSPRKILIGEDVWDDVSETGKFSLKQNILEVGLNRYSRVPYTRALSTKIVFDTETSKVYYLTQKEGRPWVIRQFSFKHHASFYPRKGESIFKLFELYNRAFPLWRVRTVGSDSTTDLKQSLLDLVYLVKFPGSSLLREKNLHLFRMGRDSYAETRRKAEGKNPRELVESILARKVSKGAFRIIEEEVKRLNVGPLSSFEHRYLCNDMKFLVDTIDKIGISNTRKIIENKRDGAFLSTSWEGIHDLLLLYMQESAGDVTLATNRMIRQFKVSQFWKIRDTFRMRDQLEMDIKVSVLSEEELTETHNQLSSIFRIKRNSIMEKEFNKNVALAKRYEEDGEYNILVPASIEDLREEGMKMRHCVGSYVDSIASGETMIFFVRNKDGGREATVEVHKSEIRQVKAKCNEKPRKEVIDFVQKWGKKNKLRFVSW
jgi:rubredoxin